MIQIKIEDILPKLLEVLPLPDGVTAETVTADQINTALDALISEEQVETLQNENKKLCNRAARADVLEQLIINRDLDNLGVTDAAERKTLTAMLATAEDYEQAVAVIRNRATTPVEPRQPLHNRKAAATPAPASDAEVSAANEAQAKRIGNRAREIQKQLGVGHTQAFAMARGEVEQSNQQ